MIDDTASTCRDPCREHRAEVQPFDFSGREVRTVLIDDQPWFVAADVCAVLGYSRVADALRMLDEDDLGTHFVRGTDDRERPAQVVGEAGLYALVMRSNRAEAKAFKRWVTHEVLPAIRRTGTYGVPIPDLTTPGGVLVLAENYADAARQLVAAEREIAELAHLTGATPKVALTGAERVARYRERKAAQLAIAENGGSN